MKKSIKRMDITSYQSCLGKSSGISSIYCSQYIIIHDNGIILYVSPEGLHCCASKYMAPGSIPGQCKSTIYDSQQGNRQEIVFQLDDRAIWVCTCMYYIPYLRSGVREKDDYC